MAGKIEKLFDIWDLKEIEGFSDRRLYIGETGRSKIVVLYEIRVSDQKEFVNVQHGKKADNIIKIEKKRFIRSRVKQINKANKPHGWTFGKNVEIKNRKGITVKIRQKRCDYYGREEIVCEHIVPSLG